MLKAGDGAKQSSHELDFDVDSSSAEDLLPSARAVLSLLPANWPDIPQLQEHHSWDYTTSVSPSVNKAREHLQLLQTSLKRWIHSAEKRTRVPAQQAERSENHALASRTSSDGVLAVEGFGLHSADFDSEAADDVLQLSAGDVIDETIVLVARLERDRLATLEKLWAEQQRVKMLSAKIDRLALARMIMLPDTVQREHEACSKDLAELKWHITYRSRTQSRLDAHAKKAESLNSQRRDEIARVKRHIPLMQEKVALEQEAMKKIKEAQIQTNEELKLVMEKCSKVKARSVEAFNKADQERVAMKKELDRLQNQLDTLCGRLTEAKLLHDEYIKNSDEYRRKTQQFQRDLPPEITRNDTAVSRHAIQSKKVVDLETSLRKAEVRHAELTLQYHGRMDEAAQQRASMKAEENELKKEVELKEERWREITNHNKAVAMDNESYERKIKNFDKQHTDDRKSLERLSRDLDRTNVELVMALEELSNVQMGHDTKKHELDRAQHECFTDEHTVKVAAETMRRTTKEEIQRKQTLHAKIDQDKTEIDVTRSTAKNQQDICVNKEAEVKKVLAEVKGKVDVLQTAFSTNSETLANLKADLTGVQQKSDAVKQECSVSVSQLTPEYDRIKSDLTKLENKLQEMKDSQEMMTKGTEDMDSSSVMINKAGQTLQQDIDILQAEADELITQQTALQNLKDDISNSIKQIKERDCNLEKQQQALITERSEILAKHSADLAVQKELNQSLASRYRQLQNKLHVEKTDLLCSYDDRIRIENDVKDAKEMLAVQQRVHAALQQYYKYRGLYSTAELGRMQSESKVNAQQVAELRQRIDETLANMSQFLRSQLDGDAVQAVDANNMLLSADVCPVVS